MRLMPYFWFYVLMFVYLCIIGFVAKRIPKRFKTTSYTKEEAQGYEFIQLVNVFSVADLHLLVSLFDSAGIRTIHNLSNFQRIQYGSWFTNNNGITVSVDVEYIDEALAITKDFIENKKRNLGAEKNRLTPFFFFIATQRYRELPEVQTDTIDTYRRILSS
jgi:predicted MPP superfamily phosphohydrolase